MEDMLWQCLQKRSPDLGCKWHGHMEKHQQQGAVAAAEGALLLHRTTLKQPTRLLKHPDCCTAACEI